MKKIVVIVAGGSGKRMNNDLPKQFILVNNKPIIMHSIDRFLEYDKNVEIVIVLQKKTI